MNMEVKSVIQPWPCMILIGIADHAWTYALPCNSSSKKTKALARTMSVVTTAKRLGRRDSIAQGNQSSHYMPLAPSRTPMP